MVSVLFYQLFPELPARLAANFALVYRLLMAKYGFDVVNDLFFVRGSKALGRMFYNVGDQRLIDGFFVNGTGRMVKWFALKTRVIQSGYLYHYMMITVLGLFGFLCWLLLA